MSLLFARFQRELLELVPVAPERVRPDARFEEIIPRNVRRKVWHQLGRRGFQLPALGLSTRLRWISFFLVLARSAALAWLFQHAVFALAALPFALVTRWLIRPLAVYPPPAYQTVWDAIIRVTPFRRVDYEAGLWRREDIATKVRAIIADLIGLSLDKVREDSRIVDLCDCRR